MEVVLVGASTAVLLCMPGHTDFPIIVTKKAENVAPLKCAQPVYSSMPIYTAPKNNPFLNKTKKKKQQQPFQLMQ